eukprot:1939914-Pyramimonas_sp.AAC.1
MCPSLWVRPSLCRCPSLWKLQARVCLFVIHLSGPSPFFPSSSLKIGSWNTHALFGAVRSQSVKAPARHARFLKYAKQLT